MRTFLDFEKPVADLEGQIQELRRLADGEDGVSVDDEVAALEAKARDALKSIYAKLTPWQKTQVARHPDRPHAREYLDRLFTEFTPLAGDRKYADDKAIVAGLARFRGQAVAVLAQEKGADTQSRIKHNFGMARPEGYRKAVRLMELADRFGLPLISLVDTAGAYPGIGAEERGQAEAIARSTEMCLKIAVPSVAVIIGEGGSGGAIAIATANRVFMLEHAIYSVISPEGAASILWKDSARAQDAATAMKITASDLMGLKIIDGVIAEPIGGAHRAPSDAIDRTGQRIAEALEELAGLSPDELRRARRDKFLAIGRSVG
ncbi:acetyl-CoA carboxylase carboxyltransferase subunit alpha [Faunimonas sp. B44]|uniref:acetyl-CoA carboxylase carboxyltransferase subunit alpha n=1 Tax=Faunimonas sp. B44 TaxID=3461493 RepID=UPI004044F2A0